MPALDLAENGKVPSHPDALARWSRALSVLLFLLSIAALIIQLGWQTALAQRFGGNAELMMILSVALGLAAGGFIGGLLAPRSPLLLLVAIAAMNGACAYVWPIAGFPHHAGGVAGLQLFRERHDAIGIVRHGPARTGGTPSNVSRGFRAINTNTTGHVPHRNSCPPARAETRSRRHAPGTIQQSAARVSLGNECLNQHREWLG